MFLYKMLFIKCYTYYNVLQYIVTVLCSRMSEMKAYLVAVNDGSLVIGLNGALLSYI